MSEIAEPNFNSYPKVADWEKIFFLLQQANEQGFRAGTSKEFYTWLKTQLDLTGLSNTAGLPETFPTPGSSVVYTNPYSWTLLLPKEDGASASYMINGAPITVQDSTFKIVQYTGTGIIDRTLVIPKPKDIDFKNIDENLFNQSSVNNGYYVSYSDYSIQSNDSASIFKNKVLEKETYELSWSGGATDRPVRFENATGALISGAIASRNFSVKIPDNAVYIVFTSKRESESAIPTDLKLIRKTIDKTIDLIDGNGVRATSLIDNAEIANTGNSAKSVLNREAYANSIGLEGENLFNLDNIRTGLQIRSGSAAEQPYLLAPPLSGSTAVLTIDVTNVSNLSVKWTSGEAERYCRWDTGDSYTELVQGVTISRNWNGTKPTGATRFVIGIKRPSEPEVVPANFAVFKGAEEPYVTTINGNRVKQGDSSKLQLTGYSDNTGEILGVPIRFILPNNYNYKGFQSKLLITCHGNTGSIAYGYNANFLTYARQNNIVLALINLQDQVYQPSGNYTTRATGYGNDITVNRIISLYEYCQHKLNVDKSAIIHGQSMGGLTAGIIAYNKPFPVRFMVQTGGTPDLLYRFTNGGTDVKSVVRNSFGMASNGTDDTNIVDFIRGNDWFSLGNNNNAKQGFPPTYLYAGNGDEVFTGMGGAAKFTQVRDLIKASGQRADYKEKAGVAHGDPSLWDMILSDGIFQKELKLL